MTPPSPPRPRASLLCAAILAALVLGVPTAQASSRLFYGFSDNAPMDVGSKAVNPAAAIGSRGYALTLTWTPGTSGLTTQDARGLSTALNAIAKAPQPTVRVRRRHRRAKLVKLSVRVILIVQTLGSRVPLDDASRTDFCDYARSAVASFPRINDVVVGNEANSSYFWRPQYNLDGSSAAPAAYEALLAQCYDVLHAFRPKIDVAAPGTGPAGNDNPWAYSNVSHSPTSFIQDMASAYKASGRTKRIFDTVVHHPYGLTSDERPYLMHPLPSAIGEGDWNRLVQTYQQAFAGTAQPVPGRCSPRPPCVRIWYLETGFQTTPPVGAPFYYGTENVRTIPDWVKGERRASPLATAPAPDQATQLRYAARLAYCQPYVDAVFNFLVRDDPYLVGYQSGVLWANWQPKASFRSLKSVVAQVNSHKISCAAPRRPQRPVAQVLPGSTIVSLSWSPVWSPVGVSGYAVFRDGKEIGTTAGVTFVDSTAAPKERHAYRVAAFDAAGKTSRTSKRVVVTLG